MLSGKLETTWVFSLLKDPANAEGQPIAVGNATAADTDVATRTAEVMEAIAEADDAPGDEDNDEDNSNQTFNPYSFWTERTGRFPRNR